MTKYVQKYIPSVTTPSAWKALSASQLRKAVANCMMKFRDLSVKNLDRNIDIVINKKAIGKTAYGEAIYGKKAAAAQVLPELLKYAKYNNWGERKAGDPEDLIGFMNFKAKCKIDGKIESVRLAVHFYKDGYFYYNIEISTKK